MWRVHNIRWRTEKNPSVPPGIVFVVDGGTYLTRHLHLCRMQEVITRVQSNGSMAIFALDDRFVSQMRGTWRRHVARSTSMQKDSLSMLISILRFNTTLTRPPTYCAQTYHKGPQIHLHFCPQTKWILGAGLAVCLWSTSDLVHFLHFIAR